MSRFNGFQAVALAVLIYPSESRRTGELLNIDKRKRLLST